MKYKAVWDKKGLLAEYEHGELVYLRKDYEPPNQSELARPMVIRDIEPYQNMIDGKMISGRAEHREFLRRNNCIEIGNEKMETKIVAPQTNRRETITRQLSDMSDRQANKIMKQLKKGI